ncbi:MAG: DNA polymerase III subunit gamma/tau [Candidatus Aminicenantes bacterium]|nr:DNA polymerase III subunit gamma/tau [Candidatus Aminicenantes bacterium]
MPNPNYTVLARKYRPMGFDEMVGQKAVVQTLQNGIRSGRIAQAYLFSGTRGVGKTTAARILAKALNCEKGPTPTPCGVCPFCTAIQEDRLVDVIEIDGASNNGIDNIRDLRELVQYKAMQSRYRVIIIDEVHQVSKPAFNALLKTLEEPPEKTIFVFATTELQKVPVTIVSRCQYFEFKRVSVKEITAHLVDIARREGLTLTETGFGLLARAADGSIRDSLTLLDQAVAFCGKTVDDQDLSLILGTINRDLLFEFSAAVIAGEPGRIFPLVEKVIDAGYDLRTFHKKLIEHFRDLLIVRTTVRPQELLSIGEADLAVFRAEAGKAGEEDLLRFLQALQSGEASMKYSSQPQIAFETLLVRMCHFHKLIELKDVIAGLDEASPAGNAGPVRPVAAGGQGAGPFGTRRPFSGAGTAPSASPKSPPASPPAKSKPYENAPSPPRPKVREEAGAPSGGSGKENALRFSNVRLFQDKLKARVVSVEETRPPRPENEE